MTAGTTRPVRIPITGPVVDEEEAAAAAEAVRSGWLTQGANLVGGCCGTTPSHIAALRVILSQN